MGTPVRKEETPVRKEETPVRKEETDVRKEEERPAAKVSTGIPRRVVSSVSISAPQEVARVVGLESREVEQLTQEGLEKHWKELADSCKDDEKLSSLLEGRAVELKNNNLYMVKVPNLYFDTLLKPYQTRINEFMRRATNNEALQYKLLVEVEEREALHYLPNEKFEELLAVNPSMLTLRKLFPDFDF